MNTPTKIPVLAILVALLLNYAVLFGTSPSGFYLSEPYTEVSLRYSTVNNLIILPVVINGKINVNLILDTGTRNIVLFGKHFQNLLEFVPERNVQFSGVGSDKPVYGKLSIDNRVELLSLIGEQIPIVVVPKKNIFALRPTIDGVIGYDIFQRFEVEINPQQQKITFRSPTRCFIPHGFVRIPLRIENTKPILDSKILLKDGINLATNLMIDTGSQLSILLKTTNNALIDPNTSEVLGKGMSGYIEGVNTLSHSVNLVGINFQNQPTGIILSDWHNYGSIGMGTLKEYAMIINYNGAYACLKKI